VRRRREIFRCDECIKKSIVTVKATFQCLAHATIITMAMVNGDLKYKSYRKGRCMKQLVQDLLSSSDLDSLMVGF